MNGMSKILAGAAVLMGSWSVQAEGLAFTVSNGVNLPAGNVYGAAAGTNACASDGLCSSALSYNTVSGGKLTVTASDGGAGDPGAFVVQRDRVNSGLGVAAGSTRANGSFQISDSNLSLDTRKETLTLSFENAVQISALYFFADNVFLGAGELDSIDGFTVAINGGAAQEYSFGSAQGRPVTFATPLVGNTFTFGYAVKKSGEDYYLGGLSIAAAVPETGGMAMMALGVAGIMLATRRRHKMS